MHFSGETATCLYNFPHENQLLPRVLPGSMLSLDEQCKRDRGTNACFVSDLPSATRGGLAQTHSFTHSLTTSNYRKMHVYALSCFVSIVPRATVSPIVRLLKVPHAATAKYVLQ